MQSKISHFSGGNAWRVFTTDFYLFPCTVSHEDYIKFCGLINQIFKNLFNIDYVVSDYVNHNDFNNAKAVFNHDSHPRHKKKNLNFHLDNTSYSIDFSFTFVEIEKLYVFETCSFSVTDKNLASKLPIDPKKKKEISCVCHFQEDQQYEGVSISYSQIIDHPESRKWLVFSGHPVLCYNHVIKKDSKYVKIEYHYKDFDEVITNPDKKFSFEQSNITPANLLKVEQLYRLMYCYNTGFEVSRYFPEICSNLLDSPNLTRCFIEDFFEDSDEMTDLLLLFDMEVI